MGKHLRKGTDQDAQFQGASLVQGNPLRRFAGRRQAITQAQMLYASRGSTERQISRRAKPYQKQGGDTPEPTPDDLAMSYPDYDKFYIPDYDSASLFHLW
jgi:hypothetical protein